MECDLQPHLLHTGRGRNLVSSLLTPLQSISSPMSCLEGNAKGVFKMWWLFMQAEHRADNSHQEQREQLQDPCIHPYGSPICRAAAAVPGAVTQGAEHVLLQWAALQGSILGPAPSWAGWYREQGTHRAPPAAAWLSPSPWGWVYCGAPS